MAYHTVLLTCFMSLKLDIGLDQRKQYVLSYQQQHSAQIQAHKNSKIL